MAKQGFVDNTYNNRRLGDVSNFMGIVTEATVNTPIFDQNSAPPDSTITSDTAGHYTLTVPNAVSIIVDSLQAVNGAGAISAVTVNAATGVVTFTVAAELSGAQQVHFSLQVCAP